MNFSKTNLILLAILQTWLVYCDAANAKVLKDEIVSTEIKSNFEATNQTHSKDEHKLSELKSTVSTSGSNPKDVRIDPEPPIPDPNTTLPTPSTTTVTPPTTTQAPNTTTVTPPTTHTPNTTTVTPPTTHTPNTTTVTPPTTTHTPNTTTVTPSTTVAPRTTPKPVPDRKFDGPSFIGGMILTMGLMAIAFVSWKFYKARTERNYHTL